MKSRKNWYLLVVLGATFFLGCGGDEGNPEGSSDNFDRTAMLINWADNLIIPAYSDYLLKLEALKASSESFVLEANADHLTNVRSAWFNASMAWQKVAMFEIGPAETLSLRNFTNTYPADTEEINEFVESGNYNFNLPSTYDAQGLPALDYLLFGIGDDEAAILELLSGDAHKAYLTALTNRLYELGNEVYSGWTQSGYRDSFISNNGSSATASVNKMVNDFVFYYEKALRAGKVGIPAGIFSGTPLSDRVEAPFSGSISKELLVAAIDAVRSFYQGVHFDQSENGLSLEDYLEQLGTRRNDGTLSEAINEQFRTAVLTALQLNGNLKTQVETDNTAMLQTYDELQKLVVLMKVDMFQALNIQVDFIDADGD